MSDTAHTMLTHTAAPRPAALTGRLHTLDYLRGMAVLGILLVHIADFGVAREQLMAFR